MYSEPKRKSKPTEEYPDPGEGELLERLNTTPEPYKSYLAFCYLIGNRVSEGLPGKSKFFDRGAKEYVIRDYSGVRKRDIVIGEDGWMEVNHLPTLKRKVKDTTKFYRQGIVFVNGRGEKPFINILLAYIANKPDNEVLWKFSRKAAWKYANKCLRIPPKKLRGIRATKDAVQYDLGALELKEKYNWGSVEMPFHYARFNKRALKKKMEDAGSKQ